MNNTQYKSEFEQIRELFRETDKKFQATDAKFKATEALLDAKFQETDAMFKETDVKFQATDAKFQETDVKFQATEKMIKNLGKEIGGIGNSIGGIAEGLSYPSLASELENRFKVEFVAPNVEKKKGSSKLELDVLAYSNSTKNEVYIIEIKATLSELALEQLLKEVEKFKEFFPEHADKKVYGIMCAIKATDKLKKQVYENGFYFASANDGLFKVHIPKNFKPNSW